MWPLERPRRKDMSAFLICTNHFDQIISQNIFEIIIKRSGNSTKSLKKKKIDVSSNPRHRMQTELTVAFQKITVLFLKSITTLSKKLFYSTLSTNLAQVFIL